MRWNTKHHRILMRIVDPYWYRSVVRFIKELSWAYAWYQNPDVMRKYKALTTKKIFWENVKYAWRARRYWEND
jgi:hypothetical protein